MPLSVRYPRSYTHDTFYLQTFAWLDGESGVESIVLGQIYGYIELELGLSLINFTDPGLPSSLRNHSPGVFAIVHSCKYVSEPLHNYSRLLLGADLTYGHSVLGHPWTARFCQFPTCSNILVSSSCVKLSEDPFPKPSLAC